MDFIQWVLTGCCCLTFDMKKTIFVVENDTHILEIVTYILSERGYRVVPFQTEDGVFDRIAEDKPDAVLLDIIKPTEIGTELCRAIKEAETTRHIPVIILSTHPKAAVVKEICADEVLAKPFDVDELIAAVDEHLVL